MGHHHEHHHGTKNIKIAFFLNLVFTIIEIVGGLFTNSMAILSDALHDLGDMLSLGLAWYFEKISHQGRKGVFSYGYRRFSTLGALINGIILIVGSIYIVGQAIPRIFSPEKPDAEGMIYLAILGIIFNGLAVYKLSGEGGSMNQKVVRLHLLEDVLGWLAVLVGAIVMFFFDLPVIDPVLSVLISLFIIWNAIKGVRNSLQIILQGMPEKEKTTRVRAYLSKLAPDTDFHDLHLWSMDGSYHIMTVHLAPRKPLTLEALEALKSKVRIDLKDLGINHLTLEIDLNVEQCEYVDC